jgi:ankyrin repeat protein
MSASLNTLPLDVYSKEIVPLLSRPEVLSFGLSSKDAYAIISNIALEPQEDRNLKGDRITIYLDKNTLFNSFMRLNLKREFDHSPEFNEFLNIAREAVRNREKDPDDISALCEYAHEVQDSGMMGAILIFDYIVGKLTGPDLGKALEISTPGSTCNDICNEVLFHPNANTIPGYAIAKPLMDRIKQTQYSGYALPHRLLSLPTVREIPSDNLSELLAAAIETKDQDFIRKILALPELNDIPGEGLSKPLTAAIKINHPGLIKHLLAHPNIKQIPGKGLPEPLEAAMLAGNQDLVNILLSLPGANTIPECSLPQLLIIAIKTNNHPLIERFLKDLQNLNEFEEGFGMIKILMSAIEENNHYLIKHLLSFPEISMCFNCNLGDILTVAIKAHNREVVEMVLNHPDLNRLTYEQFIDPIKAAIEIDDQDLIEKLFNHHNDLPIPIGALPYFLVAAIKAQNIRLLEMLLNQPSAHELRPLGLLDLIVAGMEQNNQELEQVLLSHPIIKDHFFTSNNPLYEITIKQNKWLQLFIDKLRKTPDTVPAEVSPRVEEASDSDLEQAELLRVEEALEDPNESFETAAMPDASTEREVQSLSRNLQK